MLKKLCDIINQNFGSPFLPKNMVSAEIIDEDGEELLSINIDRRDVQINGKLEAVSSGTYMAEDKDDKFFEVYSQRLDDQI